MILRLLVPGLLALGGLLWTLPGRAISGRPDPDPLDLASAQDENMNWEIGFHRPGVDAPIFVFQEYEGNLIAAGLFTQAGQALSRHIAAWDGERWQPLGSGVDSWVVAMTVYRGDLIVGGTFQVAGGRTAPFIARWDGAAWEPLGSGLDGPVWSLAVHEDRLVAGGAFSAAGEIPARHLAVWDGAEWSEFQGGTDGDVLGLLSLNGELFATGAFTLAGALPVRYIARWTGSEWTPLGSGLDSRGAALALYQGRVIAAGDFLSAGGNAAYHIAAWDGSGWAPLGSGASHTIHQLVVHEDRLVVTGLFLQAGGLSARGVAAWDGSAWTTVGDPLNDRGTAVASYRGDLYLSGYFGFAGAGLEEGASLDFLARLEGSRWRPVFDSRARGMNGPVFALAYFEGELIAAGNFTAAGNTPAYRVAKWNGRSWQPVGAGFTDAVFTLKVLDGVLYAAGQFTHSTAGVELNGIAAWNGSSWRPIGLGFNRPVYDIETWGGLLVAAGTMSNTGGRPVHRIVYWDGLTWRSLGEGLRGSVRDIAIHQGALYAAGSFTQDGTDVRYLAKWGGTRWEAMPHPFEEPPSALASLGGSLVVGGAFNTRGALSLRRIARWNGQEWLAMGEGFDAPVNGLYIHQGTLLAAGQFGKTGTAQAHGLARWDGTAWQPFGTGVSSNTLHPEVIALAGTPDRLYLGGYFTRAGSRVANFIAEWSAYVPASLSDLTAARNEQTVVLQWALGGAVEDSPEFDVYRETPGGPRIRLTAHSLWGETQYVYVDPAPPDGAASYWLAELDREGAITWHGPLDVAAIRIPAFRLAQNTPNPFPLETRIAFQVPAAERVTLVVYDLRGAEVTRLVDEVLPEGLHERIWNGRDARGEPVAAGMYFTRLRSPSGTQVRKLLKQTPSP